MNRGYDDPAYHKTHRTHVPADIVIETRFGPIGIWLSYRDQFWIGPTGPGVYRAYGEHGRLRMGASTVDAFGYVEPNRHGGYAIAKLWGTRYFKPVHSYETHRSEPMTRKQIAAMTAALNPAIGAAMTKVSPEQIEDGHRRSIRADISSERSSMDFDLNEVQAAIAKAQAHYDTIRMLERDIALPPSQVPLHLSPADRDLDALMDDIERLAVIGVGEPRLAIKQGKAA